MLSFPGNRQTTKNGKLPPTEKKMNISGKHTKRITTIVEYRGRRRSKKKNIKIRPNQLIWELYRSTKSLRLSSSESSSSSSCWMVSFFVKTVLITTTTLYLVSFFFPMFPSSTTIPSSYRQRTPISTQRETHTSANGDEISVCVWAYAGEIGAMPGLL